MSELLDTIRKALADATWSAAVRLSRQGCVRVEEQNDEEIRLAVRIPGQPVPHEVFLWPADTDWGCDCGSRAEACVHVATAAITWKQHAKATGVTIPTHEKPKPLPSARPATPASPRPRYRSSAPTPTPPRRPKSARVVHDLQREGRRLVVTRHLEALDSPGRKLPIRGSLARSGAWCSAGDLEVETALHTRTGRRIPAVLLTLVLRGLAEATALTLDGTPIKASGRGRSGVVRVRDKGDGFHLQLVRDSRIDEVFEGVVRCGDTLHPVTRSKLEPHERQVLLRGLTFGPHEVARLVGEFLPRVRMQLPLDVRTDRLPEVSQDPPHLHLALSPRGETELEVLPTLVYGDPPTARIDGGRLVLLGRGTVPIRDPKREERLRRECLAMLDTQPGRRVSLPAETAIQFASHGLRTFRGTVQGREHIRRFRHVEREIRPGVAMSAHPRGGYRVEVDGDGADPAAILEAWQGGSSMVPLLDGGFAPIPRAWLEEHGWTLAELMDAKEDDGRVPAHTAAALASLAEPDALPASLTRLRQLAEDFHGLPATQLPQGLHAELRPYQQRGVDWLAFLREAELGGLLADDMGLGKTIQALVAIATVPGPSLVVAPTSVLRNWKAECQRFLPDLSVCLYHGPQRKLDLDARMVITSYALLRRDIDKLAAVSWTYAVLDEAQAIKNPDSQVARASRRIDARHRLALTGTPVENRLEELWSLFAFALPGFLGRRETFAQRVSDALGGPEQHQALAWLRRRVRPFVLRRLKSEVAPELPARTEMVLSCELTSDERNTYEALRQSALREVRDAIGAKRTLGVLEALLRLRQAACHPGLLPGRADTSSSKQEVLVERVTTLAAEGHRALVFSQWTSFLDLVEPALAAAGVDSCRLDGSTRDRQAVVDRFQSPEGPSVFLLSLKAGGTGLNLTAADYVFHLDPWWNPAVEDQAVDRAHRIGQTRPVFSVRLVSVGTVEERIVALQHSKRELARAAIGDEGLLAAGLSSDELLALFE